MFIYGQYLECTNFVSTDLFCPACVAFQLSARFDGCSEVGCRVLRCFNQFVSEGRWRSSARICGAIQWSRLFAGLSSNACTPAGSIRYSWKQ